MPIGSPDRHKSRAGATWAHSPHQRALHPRSMPNHTHWLNPRKQRQLRDLGAPGEEKMIIRQSRPVEHCRPAHQRIGAAGSSRSAPGDRHQRHGVRHARSLCCCRSDFGRRALPVHQGRLRAIWTCSTLSSSLKCAPGAQKRLIKKYCLCDVYRPDGHCWSDL